MTKVTNCTVEKAVGFFEAARRMEAARKLSNEQGISFYEAKKIIDEQNPHKLVTGTSDIIPSEKDVPEEKIPVLEIDDETSEVKSYFIDKQEFEYRQQKKRTTRTKPAI
ncbi:hypothetical protein [Turicibacter sanguinis]|uniref:hypothetical protein n=1 Tax=Turicibacter sanguinis TaxID=154288 RepID=UPI00232B0F44|nr:hypothetical protein [Turicibacter sanguinis]MDB8576228.1 hypothetical protein [Turicibacter sanguinis]MDB8579254.1 hypothetical protein [Turicibacter sanguinis]MDB8584948.1 hypothetical protein [Turicibacter sanguinis]MDB8588150.1 hypothetical protein [Turicibacter sanguinis]MDB8599000.1 hypothetical protein [Turicibacter sanguinis]